MKKLITAFSLVSLLAMGTAIADVESTQKHDVNINTSQLVKDFKKYVLKEMGDDVEVDFVTVAEVEMSNDDKIYYASATYKIKNDKGEEEVWIGTGKFTDEGVFIELEQDGPYHK